MPSSPLTARENRVIFRCGRDHTVRDVIDAAYFRGELQPAWEALLRGVEVEKEASETDMEADDDAIAAAAEAFRYERDLITAEETEQWLEARGLTLEDFSDYFTRAHWRNVLEAKVIEPIAFCSASPDLRELLTVELFLSGEFDRMAKDLSWQAAARGAMTADPPRELIESERERFLAGEGIGADELGGLLKQLERDSSWFDEQVLLAANYRCQCGVPLAGTAPNQELTTLRLPLTRFEVEIVEVESHDAAAEAQLCVREDGMSMEEVATEARYPYRRTSILLEDIPDDSQQKFLSVSTGEVLDPIARGDGFQLCRVTGKSEPTLDDPAVRARVEARILERYFSELAAKHVEWANPMPIP